jgi:hypothetical protein
MTKVELPDDHIEFADGPSMVTGWDFEWQCFTITGFAGREAAGSSRSSRGGDPSSY